MKISPCWNWPGDNEDDMLAAHSVVSKGAKNNREGDQVKITVMMIKLGLH